VGEAAVNTNGSHTVSRTLEAVVDPVAVFDAEVSAVDDGESVKLTKRVTLLDTQEVTEKVLLPSSDDVSRTVTEGFPVHVRVSSGDADALVGMSEGVSELEPGSDGDIDGP
jgi:hypothetical protein